MKLIRCDLCDEEINRRERIDLIIRGDTGVNTDLCLACGKPLVDFSVRNKLSKAFERMKRNDHK